MVRMFDRGLARSASTSRTMRERSSRSAASAVSTSASPGPPLRSRRMSTMAIFSAAGSSISRANWRSAVSVPCGPILVTRLVTAGAIGSGTEFRERRSALRVDPAAPELMRSASRRVQSASASDVAISRLASLPPPSTFGMNTTPPAAPSAAAGQPVTSRTSTPAASIPRNSGVAPRREDERTDGERSGRKETPRTAPTTPTRPAESSSPDRVSSSAPAVTTHARGGGNLCASPKRPAAASSDRSRPRSAARPATR